MESIPDFSQHANTALQKNLYSGDSEALEPYHYPTKSIFVADTTGLGKTRHNNRRPSIVFSPTLTVAKQWVDEIHKMFPDWLVISDFGNSIPDNMFVMKKPEYWKGDWPNELAWV
ncbi:uncharacterized protein CTRU02_203148 [Colletotrichum truncatum]|uniref:Uncharacterized protein n=1 Tax=Colletotrichum truncatum TaxID=5467 RepID=A0ACC3Z8I9_COLTU